MIAAERLHTLNDKPALAKGGFVLYWMQQSQRAEWNHALEYAAERANELELPLVVAFGLMDDYPEANQRHYAFMLAGLTETFDSLRERGIKTLLGRGHPADVALKAARAAALVVCDQGYLRQQAEWRARVAEDAECEVVEVESDIVVPVETVSDHAEYMARTIRPKINNVRDKFLKPVKKIGLSKPWNNSTRKFQALEEFTEKVPSLGQLAVDSSIEPTKHFEGGTKAAKQELAKFIAEHLSKYNKNSNQPQTDDISHMSPYLHFGQISPLYIAKQIQKSTAAHVAKDAYLEQLIIRRELAINFVWFNRNYDKLECLPEWAQRTLERHAADEREHLYSPDQFEQAKTHDKYWNAAMDEMRKTGFMHNYMRMYWGKKILEWSKSPEEAFATALRLNNKYFLDGRDPNSYAGVAWIFGKHDQAWQERPVFGKTRYMNANGLKRKCDIEAYVKKVENSG